MQAYAVCFYRDIRVLCKIEANCHQIWYALLLLLSLLLFKYNNMPYVSQKANSRHTMFTANFVPKGQRWRFQQMDGRGRGRGLPAGRLLVGSMNVANRNACRIDGTVVCMQLVRCTESAMTQHPVRCVVSSLTGTRPATGFSVSVYRLIWYGWHFFWRIR